MKLKQITCVMLAASLLSGGVGTTGTVYAAENEQIQIEGMEVNDLENPLGIDGTSPKFSWKMNSDTTGAKQIAYQLVVKDAQENIVWDSGKVEDSDSTYITYSGDPLEAEKDYNWQVTVWDQNDQEHQSEKSFFSTGPMSKEDWDGAKWIELDYDTIDMGVDAYTVEGDMKIEGDTTNYAGLVFSARDQQRYFYWSMAKDQENGNYKLTPYIEYGQYSGEFSSNGEIAISKADADNKDVVTSWNVEAAEDGYVHLKIAVDVKNQSFTTYVNGEELVTITDPVAYEKVMPMGMPGQEPDEDAEPEITITEDVSKLVYGKTGIRYQSSVADAQAYYDNVKVTVTKYSDQEEEVEDVKLNADFEDGTNPFETNARMDTEDTNRSTIIDGQLCIAYNTQSAGYPYLSLQDNFEDGFAAPMLRKKTDTQGKEIEKATAYFSAMGLYKLYVNDQEVGSEDVLKTDASNYYKKAYYYTYDITQYMKNGENVLGAVLGTGWYSGDISEGYYEGMDSDPKLYGKVVITYTDGTTETIVTDDSWEAYDNGAIRYDDIWDGEVYDARYDCSYSDDSLKWVSASVNEKAEDTEVVARIGETIQVMDVLDEEELLEKNEEGTYYLYNFGKNSAGVVHLQVTAEPGTKVTIRHGEWLNDDISSDKGTDGAAGSLYTSNYRSARAIDIAFVGEDGTLDYTPDFTYRGFQYVEVTASAPIEINNIESVVLSSGVERTGYIKTNNETLNQFYENSYTTALANLFSWPTDCPQRDERFGYVGDPCAFVDTATYHSDYSAYYGRYAGTIADWQNEENGATGMSFPTENLMATGSIYAGTMIMVPWSNYLQYGDTEYIEKYYSNLRLYMETLAGMTEENEAGGLKFTGGELGDWLALDVAGDTTQSQTAADMYAIYDFQIFTKMAKLVGNTEDEEYFGNIYEGLCEGFKANYLTVDEDGNYKLTDDTQGAYGMAICLGIFDEETNEGLGNALVNKIEEAEYRSTVGFYLNEWVLPALTATGHTDTAYKMLLEEDFPSWLYPVTQGATSIWELHQSYVDESITNTQGQTGIYSSDMNSFNHAAMAAVVSWLYSEMAGIKSDSENAGYQHFYLQPTIDPEGGINTVEGSYDSKYGKIVSNWTSEEGTDGAFALKTYQATVPANTTATLYLPITEEQASALEIQDGMSYTGMEEHNGTTCAVYELEAGSYELNIA